MIKVTYNKRKKRVLMRIGKYNFHMSSKEALTLARDLLKRTPFQVRRLDDYIYIQPVTANSFMNLVKMGRHEKEKG